MARFREQIRQHTLENLDYYLMQLSENVTKRGDMSFAKTKEDAAQYIKEVAEKTSQESREIQINGNRRNRNE